MDAGEAPWSPWIAAVGDVPRPYAWRKEPRILPWWLVVCVVSGEETVDLPGATVRAGPGTTYVIPAGVRHAIRSPGSHPVWFHAELAWHPGRPRPGPGQGEGLPWGSGLPWTVEAAAAGRMRAMLPGIAARWTAGTVVQRTLAAAELGCLLLGWAVDLERGAGGGGRAAAGIARAEAAAVADPGGATVERMAAAAGWSRSRFCAVYQRVRGGSPGAFIRRRRLAAATELLTDTDLPLAAVARLSGYADAPSLVRAIGRCHGCTPQALRSARHAATGPDGQAPAADPRVSAARSAPARAGTTGRPATGATRGRRGPAPTDPGARRRAP